MKETSSERFWEIDALRGIAILMMITYHVIFDLNYFEFTSTDLNSLPLLFFLYPVGTLFLLLVGISLTLSYSRVKNTYYQESTQDKVSQTRNQYFCTWHFSLLSSLGCIRIMDSSSLGFCIASVFRFSLRTRSSGPVFLHSWLECFASSSGLSSGVQSLSISRGYCG